MRPVDLLRRGLGAGLLGGLLAGVVAAVAAEHWVDRAIAFERARAGAAGHETELVSRAWQSTAGLLTATTLAGVALGGVFALVLAGALGRVRVDGRAMAPRPLASLLAAAGFVAVTLVPWLRYPADPPGVGQPDTLSQRTGAYLIAIALSVAIATFALLLGRAQRTRLGTANAALGAAVTYVVGCCAAYAVLPTFDEIPPDFPADVLWHFRLAGLAVTATMWAVVGIATGWSTHRAMHTATGAAHAEGAASVDATPSER